MIVQKQQFKKTSYFYKKKLQNLQKLSSEEVKVQQKRKIIKSPKQAKLRAKQARQRKKNYIQFLQNKVEELSKQLEMYKEKCESLIMNSNNMNMDKNMKNNNIINNNKDNKIIKPTQNSAFTPTLPAVISTPLINPCQTINMQTPQLIYIKGIQQQFQNLYQGIKNHSQPQTIINLSNLRNKFGVAGQDRSIWLRSLFTRIIQLLMPMHCRLLLQYCKNNQQFYKLLGGSDSLKQFRKIFFNQKAKKTILNSRPLMVEIKDEYEKILHKISHSQHQIFLLGDKIQQLINKIQGSMNPLFVGRILVNLDIQRREQSLNQIFPLNYYKKCKENVKNLKMDKGNNHKNYAGNSHNQQINQNNDNYKNNSNDNDNDKEKWKYIRNTESQIGQQEQNDNIYQDRRISNIMMDDWNQYQNDYIVFDELFRID